MSIMCNEVKAGDRLIADGGFDCLTKGEECDVRSDKDGLYVACRQGQHYLDGQIGEGGVLVGFERAV